MASKKKIGDCKKIFRFAPGITAPIINKDARGFDPAPETWHSVSKMPSTEDQLFKHMLKEGKEYRVLKGYNMDSEIRYLLQEKREK